MEVDHRPDDFEASTFIDDTPISALTTMNYDQWEALLGTGGKMSYAKLEPVKSALILNGIINGVSIDFTGKRNVNRFGPNLPIDDEHIPKVTEVIMKDVESLKKAGPFSQQPFKHMAISPIGAVPKKNSTKIRVIHHLSHPFKGDSVNENIIDEYLPISSFGHAAQAVREFGRYCYLVKLDVEAAYKQVPVRREDWPLLGFKWLDQWYYERVLPFGLRSSCRLWELYAAALHHFFQHVLQCRGRRQIIHYVDDFLFVVESRDDAIALRDGALKLCTGLGIPMAADKTEGPVTCLTFLGIQIDTTTMVASLPDDKLHEITTLTTSWVRKERASIKEIQSLVGKLSFA